MKQRHDRLALICLIIALCFLVLDRWVMLDQFGFRYVDDDQSIMWYGAVEMSQGRFHEPCFYGQNYNTMLEGFVAIPLLWSGIPPNIALPIISSAFALFPFLLLGLLLYRERAYFIACTVLVLPITMSPEFGMISSMPRGFVTGVFLASLTVLPLFSKRSIFLLLTPFFAILALFANPNAVIVLFPVGLLILLNYYADRRLYLLGIAGAIPAAVLYYLGSHYYDLHPRNVVHGAWDLGYSVSRIRWASLRYFDELSPVLWGKGVFVLLLLILMATVFWARKQWKPAIALTLGIVFIIVSCGFYKVNDGIPSVFYPWARMFLAIPFLIALFLSQFKMTLPGRSIVVLPIIAIGFFGFKSVELSVVMERQLALQREKRIEVVAVSEFKEHCEKVAQSAHSVNAELVVVSHGLHKHLSTYGCSCLIADFPRIIEPELDRRTWLLKESATRVIPRVLFLVPGMIRSLDPTTQIAPFEIVSQEPFLVLLTGNTLRTDSLVAKLGFGMRPY
ncbi:MAG: hypothetical protein IPF95_00435 [Flavobacteriales bacterium]|nr:hypothetical protein [Flavobacteriales bacterium]MBK6946423.1 hypothetical protein [Flavobacteriales bacterium]MBK9536471.1 hypothetical protein [Flavobacteriales bacterium]HQV50718.1 hypothetical protein [Flavobacteriales bacterium]